MTDEIEKARQETRKIVRDGAAKFVRDHGCHCPHANPFSSEEWDRAHAAWCPIAMADAIEATP